LLTESPEFASTAGDGLEVALQEFPPIHEFAAQLEADWAARVEAATVLSRPAEAGHDPLFADDRRRVNSHRDMM
jgi:hypothetical protein